MPNSLLKGGCTYSVGVVEFRKELLVLHQVIPASPLGVVVSKVTLKVILK